MSQVVQAQLQDSAALASPVESLAQGFRLEAQHRVIRFCVRGLLRLEGPNDAPTVRQRDAEIVANLLDDFLANVRVLALYFPASFVLAGHDGTKQMWSRRAKRLIHKTQLFHWQIGYRARAPQASGRSFGSCPDPPSPERSPRRAGLDTAWLATLLAAAR